MHSQSVKIRHQNTSLNLYRGIWAQREYTSEWPDYYARKNQSNLADIKIEGLGKDRRNDTTLCAYCRPIWIMLLATCNPGTGKCATTYYNGGDKYETINKQVFILHAPFNTEAEAEEMAEILIQKINRLAELKRTGGGNTTGQPVKCYNWVNLGTFNLGRWRNGNGRETSGLPAGSGIKIWDDEDLLKDYKAARQQCVSSANGAMDSAVSAMVLIGRQASDVDNEKKRIRSFYKASLDKCQSEFDRRHKKYQNKFCE